MSFRARLSVFALEQRENPSVPALDPIGTDAPPPVDPVPPPAPTTPAIVTIIDAGGAAAGGATGTPTTPTTPTDPLLGNNGIYNIPLIP